LVLDYYENSKTKNSVVAYASTVKISGTHVCALYMYTHACRHIAAYMHV